MHRGRGRRIAAAVALLALLPPGATAAQEQEEEEKPWEWTSSFGTSLFFGASRQGAVNVTTGYDYTSSVLELSLGAQYDYGEAVVGDEGLQVNQRSWATSGNLDYQPAARFSPFVQANAEGSFERQIDRRFSGGIGAKLKFLNRGDRQLDVSVAALLERTEPRVGPGVAADSVVDLGRWSARARASRSFSDGRIRTKLITFYRPAISSATDDYTIDLDASLAIALNGSTSIQFSLLNTYDSLARSRGARSNTDGRFFISVATTL